jgi:hypothetical protein
MGKKLNELGDDSKPAINSTWLLKPVGEAGVASKLRPGLYSIRNTKSGTYVMMAPDEKTIGCWPKSDFKKSKTDTKLVSQVLLRQFSYSLT